MPKSDDDLSAAIRSSQRKDSQTSSADPVKNSARASSPVPLDGRSSNKFDNPRGLLDLTSGEKRFRLARYHPSEELGFFVEFYWIVEWDLTSQADHHQESLPHPSIHITVEHGRSEIVGVVKGRFVKVLHGLGRVFGVKFWPGGFYPFWDAPVSDLTNRVISLSEVFGKSGKIFAEAVTACTYDEGIVELAEELLHARNPIRDENVVVVRQIVDQIAVEPSITKVDDLIPGVGMSKRTLQRLFRRYVGVSVKWVIQRYRMHEAIEQIGRGHPVDWARLAINLGYFDQAHFIKDFKRFAGRTPDEYARSLGKNNTDSNY